MRCVKADEPTKTFFIKGGADSRIIEVSLTHLGVKMVLLTVQNKLLFFVVCRDKSKRWITNECDL